MLSNDVKAQLNRIAENATPGDINYVLTASNYLTHKKMRESLWAYLKRTVPKKNFSVVHDGFNGFKVSCLKFPKRNAPKIKIEKTQNPKLAGIYTKQSAKEYLKTL